MTSKEASQRPGFIAVKGHEFGLGTQIVVEHRHACLTHCGRVTQICVFNTAKLGTSASSP